MDPAVARTTFGRDFVTRAFEETFFSSSEVARRKNLRLDSVTVARITQFGWSEVAVSCLTYLLLIEARNVLPEKTTYRHLLSAIREGARQIAAAGDALAGQVVELERDTGKLSSIRREVLCRMGIALSNMPGIELHSLESSVEISTGHYFGARRAQHTLAPLARLYDVADYEIQKYDERHRRKQLAGAFDEQRPKHRPHLTKAEFITDLARTYGAISEKKPRASRPSIDDGPASPFCRFLDYIFSEFGRLGHQPTTPGDYSVPSVDTINRIMGRTGL